MVSWKYVRPRILQQACRVLVHEKRPLPPVVHLVTISSSITPTLAPTQLVEAVACFASPNELPSVPFLYYVAAVAFSHNLAAALSVAARGERRVCCNSLAELTANIYRANSNGKGDPSLVSGRRIMRTLRHHLRLIVSVYIRDSSAFLASFPLCSVVVGSPQSSSALELLIYLQCFGLICSFQSACACLAPYSSARKRVLYFLQYIVGRFTSFATFTTFCLTDMF